MTDALVSCTVGDTEYALRAMEVVAVMRAERMRPPAPSEAGIGVVTIGGERASVDTLGSTLGLSVTDAHRTHRDRHIVVLRGAEGLVGWLVDHVGRSTLRANARVLPLPNIVGPRALRWCAGALDADRRTILLLSADGASSSRGIDDPGEFPGASLLPKSQARVGPLVVTFRTDALPPCGASRYAISARRVAGLESALHVITVPGTAPPIAGISVWRGEVLPVIDFGNAGPSSRGDRRRLLIVRCSAGTCNTSIAIPVDAETALHQPTDDNRVADRAEAQDASTPPFVAGLFDVRGHTVALIDPDVLVATAFPATGAA